MSEKEPLINGNIQNYSAAEKGASAEAGNSGNVELEKIHSSLPLGYPQLAKHEILTSLQRDHSLSVCSSTATTKTLTNSTITIAVNNRETNSTQKAAASSSSSTSIFQTRKDLLVFVALLYGNFWIATCVSLQAPFFPSEAEKKGATPSQYGFVFGVYELMILITAPLFGKMVNRYSAVSICKYGMIICGASTMVFGLIDHLPSGWQFIYAAYLIRIVEGIAASAFLTASYTVMAAEFTTSVATIFAWLEAAFGVGMIIGPTLGGALFQMGGFIYPFVILGAFLVIGYFVLMCIKMSKSSLQSSSGRKDSEGNMWRFYCDAGIIFDVLGIVTTLNFLGFNAATLEPHLRQFKLTPFLIGLVFVINGAVYALSTPIWGKLVEKNMDPKMLIVFGSLLCSIGLLFLGPVSFINLEPSLPLIVMSLLLTGLGMSAKLVCSFMDAMNDSIKLRGFKNDVSTYGLVSAMFFTSCSIGAFIGPSAGGFLLETLEFRGSSVIVFAIDVAMTIYGIVFIWMRKSKKASTKTIVIGN